MNIKSLLLGSAAALVAVTGARAADAVVVADPEPMDYVRICDVYGTGFYYVPGTETCISVGGYVRYDIGVGELFGIDRDGDGGDDTYYKRARAAIQIDARQETEFGTLRGYIHVNHNYDTFGGTAGTTTVVGDINGDGDTNDPGEAIVVAATPGGSRDSTAINHAYISLGGFRVGATDSLFSTFTGYAGGVINDDLAVAYGPFKTHQISYTFTAGPVSAAVALEDGGNDVPLDDYVPHVVGGVSYSAGMFGVSAVVGYDAVNEEVAGKVRVDVKATDTISAFIMGGLKGDNVASYYGTWGGDWALWGGVSAGITDKATVNVQVNYDDAENFSAVANVDYELARNFHIIPEVAYADFAGAGDGQFGGFLRFNYSFGK
jgi:hypothetical protein